MKKAILSSAKEETALKFELLNNRFLGELFFGSYKLFWENQNARVSLLFTICLLESGEHRDMLVQKKLKYFMNNLFGESNFHAEGISVKCLDFLLDLSGKQEISKSCLV